MISQLTPTSDQINRLMSIYSRVTGIEFRLGLAFDRERQAYELLSTGITLEDFEMVLRHLMTKIRKGERRLGAVRWSTIVGRLDVLDEEISMAKAELRNLRPAATPKERVIQQLRPTMTQTTQASADAKPVAYYIEQMRSAAK